MKRCAILIAATSISFASFAEETGKTNSAEAFIRQVVQSLIDDQGQIEFEVAEKVFAIDNGEMLSREDFKRAWPEFRRIALKRKVSTDQFFHDVDLQVQSPLKNKRLMSNKELLKVYRYKEGDLYCDASRAKEGVADLIGYDKAFIYIIRQIEGRWTLIGIGG